MINQIKGLIAAPFTGFTIDGEVDIKAVARQKKFYKDNGISGVFICGTTGEGSALTVGEKKSLFREWARFREDDFAVIAFLGGTCAKECIDLALYAQECGLDAVAVTGAYYQKPSSVDALCEYCRQIASSVPDMPFFYYHIPCLTGVYMPMISLLEKMDEEIPNLAGIKYTFEDMMDYQMCLNFKDRKYNIMWGRDEMMLPALSIGAETFVGSTYGYSAPVYSEIIGSFRAGNIEKAARLQYKANILISFLSRYGNGCGKAFMKAAGLDLGPVRSPLTGMDGETYVEFVRELEENTDFGEFKCRIF